MPRHGSIKNIVRGWTQPSRTKARHYARKIVEKVDRKSSEIAKKLRTEQDVYTVLSSLPKAKSTAGLLIANRIAANFALRAIGVGTEGVKNKQIRTEVYDITRKSLKLWLIQPYSYWRHSGNESWLDEKALRADTLKIIREGLDKQVGRTKRILFMRRYPRVFTRMVKALIKESD